GGSATRASRLPAPAARPARPRPTGEGAARRGARSPPSVAACREEAARQARPPSRAARAGSRGGRTVPSGGFDQPVAAVAAAVDDLDLVRAGVPEDEEVVTDELERLDGLLRCHRAEDELL